MAHLSFESGTKSKDASLLLAEGLVIACTSRVRYRSPRARPLQHTQHSRASPQAAARRAAGRLGSLECPGDRGPLTQRPAAPITPAAAYVLLRPPKRAPYDNAQDRLTLSCMPHALLDTLVTLCSGSSFVSHYNCFKASCRLLNCKTCLNDLKRPAGEAGDDMRAGVRQSAEGLAIFKAAGCKPRDRLWVQRQCSRAAPEPQEHW